SEVLRCLNVIPKPAVAVRQATGSVFVGRRRELHALHQAFEKTRQGRPAVTVVCGQSGVGKTALLTEFGKRVLTEVRVRVLLQGGCRGRESVPCQATDGVVDALARFLARPRAAEVEAILPPRAALLTQLFPVLRLIDSLSEAAPSRPEAIDPQ